MKPLLVQHHIPKTGGTSLRLVTAANLPADAVVNLDRKLGGAAEDWRAAVDHYREYYERLGPGERAGVQCFVGHAAPFLIRAVTDRPLRAFCMLRDPVERVLSHYLFRRWRASQGASSPEGIVESMQAHGWTSLKDVYRELGELRESPADVYKPFWQLFNGQTRHILMSRMDPAEIPFDPSADALADHGGRAQEVLSDSYVVGTQDRFSQSVRLFADSFGWRRVFVPRQRVNPERSAAAEVDEETREMIRAHNRLDAGLHARYSEELRPLPATGRVADVHGRARQRAHRGADELRRRLTRRFTRTRPA